MRARAEGRAAKRGRRRDVRRAALGRARPRTPDATSTARFAGRIRAKSHVPSEVAAAEPRGAVRRRGSLTYHDRVAKPIDISVVVATLDRPEALRRALDSLAPQLKERAAEIVVVDQSAGDETAAVCSARATTYVRAERRGISRNRNLGAARAGGRWLFFLDDDAWVEPGWADAVWRAIRDDGSDFVGCLILDDRGRPIVADQGAEPCVLDPTTVWRCGGAALLVRAGRFAENGGFDARFGAGARWGCAEETDLVLRILARGGVARFDPAIVVRHPAVTVPAAGGARRAFRYGLGHGALLRKHLPGPQGEALAPSARRLLLDPLWQLTRGGASAGSRAALAAAFCGRWIGLFAFGGGARPPDDGGGAAGHGRLEGLRRSLALVRAAGRGPAAARRP